MICGAVVAFSQHGKKRGDAAPGTDLKTKDNLMTTHNRHARGRMAALLAGTALAAWPLAARAQSPAPATSTLAARTQPAKTTIAKLNDIVVTARHRREDVQKIPIAISVLGGRQLDETGVYTLAQAQHDTPNLVSYNSNSRNSSIAIRGIGVNSASDGLDTTVGVYVDGVYFGRPGMALADLIDIDQIEILRGPQGTLYGQNSAAGALNITTESPSFTPNSSVEVSTGNYGYTQERATVTGPVNDKVAVRLTLYNTDRDGTLKNSGSSQDSVNSLNHLGGRLDVLLTPTPNLTITLRTDYWQERDSQNVSVITADVATTASQQELKALEAVAKTDHINWAPTRNADSTSINSAQNQRNSTYGTSAQVDYRFDNLTFTSISALRSYNFNPLQDSDGTPLDILQVNVAQTHDTQLSQEFRLAGPAGGALDWQVGAFLFHQRLYDNYILNQYGADAAAYYNDLYDIKHNEAIGTPPPAASRYVISTASQYDDDVNTTEDSAALFGQGTWHVTDKLAATAGLRFTEDRRYGTANSSVLGTITNDAAFGNDNNLLAITGVGARPASLTPLVATDAEFRGVNTSGTAGLSYKVTPNTLVYANVSDGYQAGGVNLDVAVPASEEKIAPVVDDDWEAGVKTALFDHRLIVDADAYFDNIYNYQANIYPLDGAKSYLANIKGIRAEGVEGDVTWLPIDGLLLRADGDYNNAYYTSYDDGQCPPEYTGTAPACDETGRPVYYAPKWNGNVTAEYTNDINERDQAYGIAQYSYTSGFYEAINDSAYAWQTGYGLTNLRLGVRFNHDKYDLSLWANNVFNVKYYTTLGASSYGFISGIPGDPLTVGATLRANF